MKERTLVIVKPDAVERRLAGDIIHKIEENDYNILKIDKLILTEHEAEAFYSIHKDKEFFGDLIDFMTSGPCIPMIVEGDDAVHGIRKLVGATDPEKAEKGTIREQYGTTIRKNSIHASDSQETAAREICFFFKLRSIA